ncbi:hypothetical protein J6590_054527 [Homalodisca vitripennis]|nr:hypothetical protein J6590_054527 [Homalodisca vitripennis]
MLTSELLPKERFSDSESFCLPASVVSVCLLTLLKSSTIQSTAVAFRRDSFYFLLSLRTVFILRNLLLAYLRQIPFRTLHDYHGVPARPSPTRPLLQTTEVD